MKKKCTNSACRLYFTPALVEGVCACPYCGKVYPRLSAKASSTSCSKAILPEEENFTFRIYGMKPGLREVLPAVKTIRTITGWGLKETLLPIREFIRHGTPCFYQFTCRRDLANYYLKELNKAGFRCRQVRTKIGS